MRHLKPLFASAVLSMLCAAPALAETFSYPELNGTPIDYCLHFASQCGKPAADRFCVINGYQSAVNFAPAANLGHTVIIGDAGSECNNARCGGFQFIECQ